jgi:5,10-methylenetetrahydrofolate reductase
MRRTLREALARRPLLFEPTPPSSRAPRSRVDERLARVSELVDRHPRVDLIDVPELLDENHEGRPFLRSGDVRDFGARLASAVPCPVAVNKVVAHLPSAAALETWSRETIARGLTSAILVGGSSRYIPYPGPSVVEADRLVRPLFEGAGGCLGNIAIPTRTGEAHRLLAKTRAGATFFTTQILFDSAAVIALVREYDGLCRRAGVAPGAVVLSVVPIIDEGDAEFIRWLGAEIPEETEREILGTEESEGATGRTVGHALKIWGEVTAALGGGATAVPIGVNVEEITPRHSEAAAALLAAFARAIDADGPALAANGSPAPAPP